MDEVLLPDIPDARVHRFNGRHPPFRFACVPCYERTPNWSLDQLPMIGVSEFSRELNATLDRLAVSDVFVPATWKFNGAVLPPGAFISPTQLQNVCVWRKNNLPADGTYLVRKGQAVAISPGGCPTVVATRGDRVAVAHAGEKCLFDYQFVAEGRRTPGRAHSSVVDSILKALEVFTRSEAQQVHVWVFYSITMRYHHSLDDPVHHVYNRNLCSILGSEPYAADKCMRVFLRDMHLNLPAIISRQCIARGVPWPNVNLEHSVLPVDDELFPTTRALKPQDRARRYLAVTVRL